MKTSSANRKHRKQNRSPNKSNVENSSWNELALEWIGLLNDRVKLATYREDISPCKQWWSYDDPFGRLDGVLTAMGTFGFSVVFDKDTDSPIRIESADENLDNSCSGQYREMREEFKDRAKNVSHPMLKNWCITVALARDMKVALKGARKSVETVVRQAMQDTEAAEKETWEVLRRWSLASNNSRATKELKEKAETTWNEKAETAQKMYEERVKIEREAEGVLDAIENALDNLYAEELHNAWLRDKAAMTARCFNERKRLQIKEEGAK